MLLFRRLRTWPRAVRFLLSLDIQEPLATEFGTWKLERFLSANISFEVGIIRLSWFPYLMFMYMLLADISIISLFSMVRVRLMLISKIWLSQFAYGSLRIPTDVLKLQVLIADLIPACDQITDAINTQIDSRLSNLTMLKKIYDGLELDYSLISNPNVTSLNFDTLHKGEVYAIGHHTEAPVDRPFIFLDQETTNMVYVWISDYLLNSACYVLHTNDYLQRNITQEDIPEGSKFSLNTSGFPLAIFFPKVHAMHPDMMTQFQVSSTKEPVINTTREKMTLSASVDVEAYVTNQNDIQDYLFALGVNLTVSAVFAVKKHNVTWKANYESVHLELEDSAIPDMNIDILQKMLPLALKTYVIPMVNKMGIVGKPLPTFEDYHATATKINLGKGFLKIGTDLRVYNPIEETFEDLFNSLF